MQNAHVNVSCGWDDKINLHQSLETEYNDNNAFVDFAINNQRLSDSCKSRPGTGQPTQGTLENSIECYVDEYFMTSDYIVVFQLLYQITSQTSSNIINKIEATRSRVFLNDG